MTRRRRYHWLVPYLVLLGPGLEAAEPTLATDTTLWKEPESNSIAAFLPGGTPLEVVEEREGWVQVKVTGWVRASAMSRESAPTEAQVDLVQVADPPPPPSMGAQPARPLAPPPPPSMGAGAAPPTASAPPSMGSGPSVEGIVRVKLGKLRKPVGAGVTVLLLAGDHPVDTSLRPEAEERLAQLDGDLTRLQSEAEKAMHGSNFTESAKKRDEIMKQHAAVLEERQSVLAAEHGRHELSVRTGAVAAVTADSKGFFLFPAVAAGNYRLYARLINDKADLEWVETVEVGHLPVKLSLDESNAHGIVSKAE